MCLGQIDSFVTIDGAIRVQTRLDEQLLRNDQVDRLVFDDQDACVSMASLEALLGRSFHRFRQRLRCIAAALSDAYREPEGTALAQLAVHTDFAVHQLHQAFAEGEPKPGSTVFSGGRCIRLLEYQEKSLLVRRTDADAGIRHFEAKQHLRQCLFDESCTDGHMSTVGEFDGIPGKVDQDLTEAQRISQQRLAGQPVGNIDRECEPFVCRPLAEDVLQIADHLAQGEGDLLEGHMRRLDLRQIENIVDQPEQVMGCDIDLVQIILLVLIRGTTQGQGRHAHDMVHRGAQFVTHVCQKRTLREACGFGLFLGGRQFAGSFLDQVFLSGIDLRQFDIGTTTAAQ